MNTRESDVRREGSALLRRLGCAVYALSQPRRSGIACGIPDIYVVPPRGLAPFWWEAKTPEGIVSIAQERFQDLNARSGMVVVIGGVAELRSHLATLRLLREAA